MPPLFLDTSIQVDRIVAQDWPDKRVPIKNLLDKFDYLATCSYSRLEFKRVVIQNLALTLHYLIEEKSFFRAMQRATRLQRSRRTSTLINIMAWVGHRVDGRAEVSVGSGVDETLTLQAESYIRNGIRSIWKKFDRSVDSVLDKTECKRATEAPRVMPSGEVDASIPESQCRSKECNNANFLRSKLPTIRKMCDELEKIKHRGGTLTDELEEALKTLRSAEGNFDRLYDYQRCLAVGDVWIHLESLAAGIKSFATTNYKESQVLCPIFGLEMKPPTE
ncbi:hypothetical protein AYO44_09970 [Planctomycetaceae bacterium SCGC AG-212-F19]|nr:hypothetical protein AYO44_09970 [Planctomycetaceae bacterium SCGC AG-212-F19]